MGAIKNLLEYDKASIVVILLGIAYAAGVVLVRWNMVAKPIRHQILSRLHSIAAEANGLPEPHKATKVAVLGLVAEARRLFSKYPFLDWAFWSRGQETANWQLIDHAECMLIETWPMGRVEARLLTAIEELKHGARPEGKAIAEKIEAAHKDMHPGKGPQSSIHHALLQEAILAQRAHLHEEDIEIDYYSNKLMWYIGISLVVVVLVAIFGNQLSSASDTQPSGASNHQLATLGCLLAGCVGGVLSRLMQTVNRPARSVEYSSRWMVLFLSPLAGALAGWGGLVLLHAGVQANILNTAIGGKLANSQVYMGLALLFGFSERLFTGIVESVTEGILAKDKGQQEAPNTPK